MQGADSFSAEQKHTRLAVTNEPVRLSKTIVKTDFEVEILANFKWNVYFLAAFSTSAVPLYDEVENAASASE